MVTDQKIDKKKLTICIAIPLIVGGITFRSSYVPGGTNITLFNPEVAKAIASAPYKMDSIIYRARRIFPLKHLEAFDIIATNQKSNPKDP